MSKQLEEKIRVVIAFDGWKEEPRYVTNPDSTYYVWTNEKAVNGATVIHFETAAYHSDWNWLHSAWEKLNKALSQIIENENHAMQQFAVFNNNKIAEKIAFSHKPLEAFNALYETIVFINEIK